MASSAGLTAGERIAAILLTGIGASSLLAAPIASAADAAERERTVEIRLEPRAAVSGELGGVVRFSTQEREPTARVEAVRGLRSVQRLPVGSLWRACAEIEGWWAPCSLIAVDAGAGALHHTFELWPTGRLSATLRSPTQAGDLPDSIVLAFRTPHTVGRAATVAPSTRECPLSPDGSWTCEIPATVLDVEIRTPGFVPERRWGLEIERGGRLDLGSLALRKGASVAAWVEVADGDGNAAGSAARLFPFVPGGPQSLIAERAARTVAEAKVLPNGFVQVGPVDPGSYVFEIVRPGYAPARVFPVQLWGEQETELRDPVVLRRPLAVEIRVTPPTDWRGLPWRLDLVRSADLSGSFAGSPAFLGTTDAEGRAVAPDQAPGTFQLRVFDSVGDPFYARRDLVVAADAAEIEVEIDLVTVHGLVLLDEQAVQGKLWFGGRRAASHVELGSDLEGRFTGALPRAGWWRLQIEAPKHHLALETRVEVKPDRNGDAELRIELPDTYLFGRVVDQEGRPIEGARVRLRDSLAEVRDVSKADGGFEFRAFEPGPASVTASAYTPGGSLTGQPVSVPVVEAVPFGPVVIRLVRTRTLRGRVISADGAPVAGAFVDLSTLWPETALHGSSVRTQPDGTFEATVHPSAERLQAIVSPPGYALQSREVPVQDPLVLTVSGEHGDLVIDRGPEAPEEDRAPHRLVLLQDGVVISHQRLANWAQGHGRVWRADGQSIEVPRVAPGSYRACLVRTDAMAEAALRQGSWLPALVRCDEGFLGPGGQLTLHLPAEKSADGEGR